MEFFSAKFTKKRKAECGTGHFYLQGQTGIIAEVKNHSNRASIDLNMIEDNVDISVVLITLKDRQQSIKQSKIRRMKAHDIKKPI